MVLMVTAAQAAQETARLNNPMYGIKPAGNDTYDTQAAQK